MDDPRFVKLFKSLPLEQQKNFQYLPPTARMEYFMYLQKHGKCTNDARLMNVHKKQKNHKKSRNSPTISNNNNTNNNNNNNNNNNLNNEYIVDDDEKENENIENGEKEEVGVLICKNKNCTRNAFPQQYCLNCKKEQVITTNYEDSSTIISETETDSKSGFESDENMENFSKPPHLKGEKTNTKNTTILLEVPHEESQKIAITPTTASSTKSTHHSFLRSLKKVFASKNTTLIM